VYVHKKRKIVIFDISDWNHDYRDQWTTKNEVQINSKRRRDRNVSLSNSNEHLHRLIDRCDLSVLDEVSWVFDLYKRISWKHCCLQNIPKQRSISIICWIIANKRCNKKPYWKDRLRNALICLTCSIQREIHAKHLLHRIQIFFNSILALNTLFRRDFGRTWSGRGVSPPF